MRPAEVDWQTNAMLAARQALIEAVGVAYMLCRRDWVVDWGAGVVAHADTARAASTVNPRRSLVRDIVSLQMVIHDKARAAQATNEGWSRHA